MSRGITKGLNEINRAADKIKKGDLHERAKILAKDEIGHAAHSINEMTEQLTSSHKEIHTTKEDLQQLANKLQRQNTQLVEFAHITSHNLRAPASNLFSLLYLYKKADTLEEKGLIFEHFETVVTHLSDNLNDMMEAIQIKEEGGKELEMLSFETILKKTTQMISMEIIESGAVITHDFTAMPSINYNKKYLESIIQNLLSNAIKYRSPDRRPEIHFKTELFNGNFRFSVCDNGLGLDMQKHGKKLFGLRKTFHRNNDAKGVGLFITKTQVEAMGGSISAISEKNKGSTFFINFNTPV